MISLLILSAFLVFLLCSALYNALPRFALCEQCVTPVKSLCKAIDSGKHFTLYGNRIYGDALASHAHCMCMQLAEFVTTMFFIMS